MATHTAVNEHGVAITSTSRDRRAGWLVRSFALAHDRAAALVTNKLLLQLAIVFLGYVVAGKLGQATTAMRSGNLGPVWPASGIALAGLLAYGLRAWPAVLAGSFVVAFQSPVPALTALGQSLGSTAAAAAGAFLLRRRTSFDPGLSSLRDTLAVIVGAFASSILSATIGLASLYASGLQTYSGLGSGWLIYWWGDATGVLLVTPLIFTCSSLLAIRSRKRLIELAALLTLLVGACLLVFGDLPLFSVRFDVLAFSVLPLVMWAAIDFGAGGAALSVFLIATMATLLTAAGFGPFSLHTAFVNAALLDVLFTVLAISGLVLAAVIAERERAEAERERLIRVHAATETRLRLAAIVESSNDAIFLTTLEGTIESWNAAAHRVLGFTEAEALGQPAAMLMPVAVRSQTMAKLEQLRAGRRVEPYETLFVTKGDKTLNMSVTISSLTNVDGTTVGAAMILRDFTEKKATEALLSGLSRRLIEAQEQERTRIARELHDDIGQRLALLVSSLTARAAGASRADAQMIEFQRQTSEIAADVQSISHRLHSSKLALLGMAVTMRRFCSEFASQHKTAVKFESHDVPDRVSPDISLCLFRILQEALHNAAKHSGSRQFEVEASSSDGQLHLVVRDHGRGFDVDAAKRGHGIGLISMEERIKLVHGDLSIESQPSRGTTIHARVPLRPSNP